MQDTLYALSSAPGRAGVSVIRLSGPHAASALAALGVAPLQPRRATVVTLTHPQDGAAIDQCLALFFPSPASFTGEDVAELHVHGSRAVIARVFDALSALPGLRLAQPGEFSRRAFAAGKLDLTAIEGLADLIDAETEAQRAQALRLLQGEAGAAYADLRSRIVRGLAHLEAFIDFPDEDLPAELDAGIRQEMHAIAGLIEQLLDDNRRGERIRDGLAVVILGAPNAGKSSLLNALARRDAAIVSQTAGTTRDIIEVHLDIAGYAVTLVDTAGLRESDDPIEREGINRARARAQTADLKLLLLDGARLPHLDTETLSLMDDTSLMLVSKADCLGAPLPESLVAIPVSTTHSQGLDALLTALQARLQSLLHREDFNPGLITRARHRQELQAALSQLKAFQGQSQVELAAENLRRAAFHIGRITGKIPTEELLDTIFRDFCIGK